MNELRNTLCAPPLMLTTGGIVRFENGLANLYHFRQTGNEIRFAKMDQQGAVQVMKNRTVLLLALLSGNLYVESLEKGVRMFTHRESDPYSGFSKEVNIQDGDFVLPVTYGSKAGWRFTDGDLMLVGYAGMDGQNRQVAVSQLVNWMVGSLDWLKKRPDKNAQDILSVKQWEMRVPLEKVDKPVIETLLLKALENAVG